MSIEGSNGTEQAPGPLEDEHPKIVVDLPSGRSVVSVVIGFLLIAIGAASLLERVLGINITVIPLVVGLLLLFASNQKRSRPLMIAGWTLTGLGAGYFLQTVVMSLGWYGYIGEGWFNWRRGEWVDVLPVLGLAGGFLAIYLVDKSRPAWAAITAAVLGVISGGRIIADTIQIFVPMRVFVPQATELVFPLIVIGIGVFFLVRAFGRSDS